MRLAVLCALIAAPLAAQQSPSGRLEGVVNSGTPTSSRSAAAISIVRLDPEPAVSFDIRADSTGRFLLDSVPIGRYLAQVTTPFLDSLGLALPSREVTIASGTSARFDVRLPSGSTLREAMCPGLVLGTDKAVVAGRAFDAADNRALDSAAIVVSWTDIVVDPATLETERVARAATIRTRSQGEYRLCGVPAETRLSIQLQHDNRTSAAIEVSVSANEGVVARDFSLRAGDNATVTGIVRGAGGLPLANVDLHVRDATGSVTSDSAGRFILGGLPGGTQVLVARRIGYALAEVAVELRSGQRVSRDVQLTRTVSLEPIVVSEYRTRFREFEFNRGVNIMAEFLTAEMIARRNPDETSDLVDRIPGFTVVGHGAVAKVFTNKSYQQGTGCPANVVVDDVQEMGVNDVRPAQVVGIEAYQTPPQPSIYRNGHCGLVVIWTTAWRRPTRAVAVPSDTIRDR